MPSDRNGSSRWSPHWKAGCGPSAPGCRAEIWYNHVKGLNPAAYFGIFDVVRLDTVWLDKA